VKINLNFYQCLSICISKLYLEENRNVKFANQTANGKSKEYRKEKTMNTRASSGSSDSLVDHPQQSGTRERMYPPHDSWLGRIGTGRRTHLFTKVVG
jgi:hypothetical protein